MTRLFVLSVAALGLLGVAQPAIAKNKPVVVTAPSPIDSDTPVRYVSYRDLNLITDAGARTLMNRVRWAAKDVCSATEFDQEMLFTVRCNRTALHRATPQVEAAIQRAREIAMTGQSSIAAAAIVIAP